MSRHQRTALLASLFLLCQAMMSVGQDSRADRSKFHHERVVTPGGPGPSRLLIDAALLAGGDASWQVSRKSIGSEREPMIIASGGLKDLRIYDSLNREVPYLLILPPAPEPKWQDGRIAPVALTKKTSGLLIDFGHPVLMDRLQLTGLPAPFVKRGILDASIDSRNWQRLREDATIYDMPSEKLRLLEIEFDQGEYRFLKIIWDDSASPRIPIPRTASARLVSAGSLPPQLGIPVKFERRESEPEVSRYRLRLPSQRLPVIAIKISVNGGNVLRQARITEGRLTAGEIVPNLLGTATLRRQVRGELSAAEMSVTIAPPQEAQLDLMIEDGNNPPLEITEISAICAYLPWIYFESTGKDPLTTRYGCADLREPHYDLEAARDSAQKVKTTEAKWGAEGEATAEAESAEDAGVPVVGSTIDTGGFRYARIITAFKSGLSALPLDAAVLAHGRIADLRIAGPDGKQIPYLVENVDEPLSLDLPPLSPRQSPFSGGSDKPHAAGTRTYYRLLLPYQNLPPAKLVFTTTARIFRRNLSLRIEKDPLNERQEPWMEEVAETTWAHADPETPPPPVTIRIPSLKTAELMMVVDEGDNNPLPINSARLLLPSHRLRFFRKDAENLKLYYGKSDIDAPNYDLAILAPQLMGAAAEEVQLGPEIEVMPIQGKPLPLKLFWAILIGAVLVLLVLISRLVKKS
jgi:hypothetical protein